MMTLRLKDSIELSPDVTNSDRAGFAASALREYRRQVGHNRSGEDFSTSVQDLLTDLRHFCDQEGIDFDPILRNSAGHHAEEVAGDELAVRHA